jgi:hypothetical protein
MSLKNILVILLTIAWSLAKPEEGKVDITVYDNIINGIKIRDYTEVERYLNTTDTTYFVYFYNKTGMNSVMGAYYLQKLDRKLDYITKIFLIDCNELIQKNSIKQCQIHKNTTFDPYPQFELLIPPLYRFDPSTKQMNTHTNVRFSEKHVTEDTLYRFIVENIVSYSTQIDSTDILDTFMYQPVFNKIILFTEKETTPLIYKGLTNYYYDRLLFGEIRSNQTELISRFNITKFPSIVLVENSFLLNDKPKIHYYTGSTRPGELIKYFDDYALRSKYYVKNNYEKELVKNGIKRLDNHNYDDFFKQSEGIKKAVYFTNGAVGFNELSLELKSFVNATNGYIAFGNLDCSAFAKICEKEFSIKDLSLNKLVLFDKGENFYKLVETSVDLPLGHGLFNYFSKDKNVKEITSDEYFDIIKSSRQNEKHPLIYLNKGKDLVASLPLYIISSIPEYHKRFEFYSITNPDSEVLNHLRVTINLPAVAILLHQAGGK